MKTITLKIDNDTIAQLIDLLIEVEDNVRADGRDKDGDAIEEIILQLMNQEDPDYSSGVLAW